MSRTVAKCDLDLLDESCEKIGCCVYEAEKLARVTHVFDMDGFIVAGKFHAKEICLLDVVHNVAWRADVLLPGPYHKLPAKDQARVKYCTHKVHGMFWVNYTPEQWCDERRMVLRDAESVGRAIKRCLDMWREDNGRPVLVAYKGGTFERDLLVTLGEAWIDLNDYACPKFDFLVGNQYYANIERTSAPLSRVRRTTDTDFVCDLHRAADRPHWHCPVVECRVFARWIRYAVESASEQASSRNSDVSNNV